MPASYTIRRSVPRNTRRSKPASTPSTCFPSFSINLFMAFPLPRGDLSSNTTNIIREQETPSPFGCGYAALCIDVFALENANVAGEIVGVTIIPRCGAGKIRLRHQTLKVCQPVRLHIETIQRNALERDVGRSYQEVMNDPEPG